MFTEIQVPLFFLTTSKQFDVVESFEKRIKSRFSHLQILIYEVSFEEFTRTLQRIICNCTEGASSPDEREMIEIVGNLMLDPEVIEILRVLYDKGKEISNLGLKL